jgi:acetoin utilization deacetylase AcuC-like enzyme
MSLTVFTSDRFADHLTPPWHPERVERAEVMQVVASEFGRRGGEVREPRSATDAELARIHDREYISLIAETAGRATALDPDTYTSPDSYEVALLAAGAALASVEHVLEGPGRRALAMVRPPGHHAERNRAMGFCLFNNIAVAAAHARARGVERVAIVDYDVHHGNGTQWSFYDDPSVMFISSHQYPFYPGTGAATETGVRAGMGFTVNLPLDAGATDADFDAVYTRIALPVLEQFQPGLILISAGFDALADDPVGGLRATVPGITRLTTLIGDVANRCCEGRVVAVTEGGYDLVGIADGLRGVIQVLADEVQTKDFAPPSERATRGNATADLVTSCLREFWTI